MCIMSSRKAKEHVYHCYIHMSVHLDIINYTSSPENLLRRGHHSNTLIAAGGNPLARRSFCPDSAGRSSKLSPQGSEHSTTVDVPPYIWVWVGSGSPGSVSMATSWKGYMLRNLEKRPRFLCRGDGPSCSGYEKPWL